MRFTAVLPGILRSGPPKRSSASLGRPRSSQVIPRSSVEDASYVLFRDPNQTR